jgi:hypothetical protein
MTQGIYYVENAHEDGPVKFRCGRPLKAWVVRKLGGGEKDEGIFELDCER